MGAAWFGHYRLERLLGSGGAGRVWLARDTSTDRDVALKVLAADLAADPGYRRRFTREARLAAQLRGPHTVRIHGFGELDGRLYLDMELVEGVDGSALLRREGRLSPERAVRIVAQAAAALAAAHRIGLVHRDVKPSNLMIGADDAVHLIDFGTATRGDQPALTATGQLVGTLGYVAPERFSGTADPRADQYSLACVLFELLTGRRPFGDGDSPQQVLAHLMSAPPAARDLAPGVPAELDAVIARGMAKEPDRRFPGIGEFAAAATAAVRGQEGVTADLAPAAVAAPPAAYSAGSAGSAVAYSAGSAVAYSAGSAVAYSAGSAVAYPAGSAVAYPAGSAVAYPAGSAAAHPDDPAADAPPTVFAGAPEPPATRPVPSGSGDRRPRLAVAALAAIAALIGGALLLDRPGATGTAVPATGAGAPTAITLPPIAAPIAEPAAAATPIAGQPCDPAVDVRPFEAGGGTLYCAGTDARWTRAAPAPAPAEQGPGPAAPAPGAATISEPGTPGNGTPGNGNSGNGNSGNGNSGNNGNGNNGNGNNGNGNGKPDKPGKPDK